MQTSLREKIRFLVTTYIITIVLWSVVTHLAAYFSTSLSDVNWLVVLANLDRYKIVIILLLIHVLGRWLNKQPKMFHIPGLLFYAFVGTIMVVCVNIRWGIDPYASEYFSYCYMMIAVLLIAQTIRIIFLVFLDQKNNMLHKYGDVIARLVFVLIIGLVVYFVFTISEQSNDNPTILGIDNAIINYLKYPLLLLVFMADYAFTSSRPTFKSLPYNLYGIKVNEPMKAAGMRLCFLILIYVFVAGSILSSGMLRNTFTEY